METPSLILPPINHSRPSKLSLSPSLSLSLSHWHSLLCIRLPSYKLLLELCGCRSYTDSFPLFKSTTSLAKSLILVCFLFILLKWKTNEKWKKNCFLSIFYKIFKKTLRLPKWNFPLNCINNPFKIYPILKLYIVPRITAPLLYTLYVRTTTTTEHCSSEIVSLIYFHSRRASIAHNDDIAASNARVVPVDSSSENAVVATKGQTSPEGRVQ